PSQYKTGETGAPVILDNTTAYMEARVTGELDVGTHTIFVGEIIDAGVFSEDECLTYAHYHQIKGGTTPKTAPSYIPEKETASDEKQGMDKYRCAVCGYVYNPEKGDPRHDVVPGTAFADLPEKWVCPVCGAVKSKFYKV
ncbi:rubredoxin, partial [Chloroflexota bacterium]